MSDTAPRADDLDTMHDVLCQELARLLTAGEQVLAEVEAIDHLRASMADDGDWVTASRRARREAMRARTQAGEAVEQAHAMTERSRHLAQSLDAVTLRARALLDLHPPPGPLQP